MPRGDRTGPNGEGPMTGRALGYCSGNDAPGFTTGFGGGRGRGFGRGFGRGRGRGFSGFGRGGGRFGSGRQFQNAQELDELQVMRERESLLRAELDELRARLDELEGGNA